MSLFTRCSQFHPRGGSRSLHGSTQFKGKRWHPTLMINKRLTWIVVTNASKGISTLRTSQIDYFRLP